MDVSGPAQPRAVRDVFESHLKLRRDGALDEDLRHNYHPEVVVLTARGAFRGHDGVRECAHLLWRAVADAGAYVYDSVLVDDRFALMEWHAATDEIAVTAGVDSYVIEDGLIVAQSIHYRVENLDMSLSAETLTPAGQPGPTGEEDPARAPELTDHAEGEAL